MPEFTSIFSKSAKTTIKPVSEKTTTTIRQLTDEYHQTTDGMSASQQELFQHALAKNDQDLLKAQEDVISNPEFYRKLMYGGTQKGRPGADRVDWTHPIFAKGRYRMNYLRALLNSSKEIETPKFDKGKGALVITGTVAGVTTTTEADATPLGNISKNLITGTMSEATERFSRFSEDEIKAAEAEVARYEAIEKELKLNPNEILDEDKAQYSNYTDVQRILHLANDYASTQSVFDVSWKKNVVDVWTTRLEHEITDEIDLEWLEFGRDEWYKENLAPYNFTGVNESEINKTNGIWDFKKWWDEADPADLPSNKQDTLNLFRRYADEYSFSRRLYAGDTSLIFTKPGDDWYEFEAMVRGFSTDIVTSFASPQELALMLTTFGGSKVITTSNKMAQAKQAYDRASKAKKAVMGYGGTAILGSATALSVEEIRQAMKGIDLDNSDVMVILGGLFGVSTYGLPKAYEMAKDFFMRLTKSEQTEALEKVAKEVIELQQEGQKKVDGTKIKKDEDRDDYDELEQEIIDKGYEGLEDNGVVLGAPTLDRSGIATGASQTTNPSPLLRAYDLGIKPIYDLLSKIKASTSTLMQNGKPVVQQGTTADSIYRVKYVGTHNKLIANLRNLTKASKMKRNDFNIALDTAVKQQTALHRQKRVEIEVLSEFIKVRKAKLKSTKDPKELLRLKTVINKYEKKLEAAKATDVEVLKSGNPYIDQAVLEVQDYYKVYNTNIHSLDREALLKKQGEELDDVAAKDGDIEALMDKHDQELLDLDEFYKGRHLGYSPRYWNKEALDGDPKAVEKLTRALLRSPYAQSLKTHDPKGYKEFIKEIPAIVKNMRKKINDADMENNLRDISGARAGGQGDKAKGKSEISRRIDVDELTVQDLVQTDWTTVTQAYNHDLGHKLAVREALDIKNWDEFEELYMPGIKESLSKSNLSPDAQRRAEDDVKVIVQEALGLRGLIKKDNHIQRAKRVILDTTNAIFSPGFGLTTLLEAGPVMTHAGRDMINVIMPSIKQVIGDYRAKGFDEDSMDAIKGMGIAGNIQNSLVSSRLEDGTFYAFNKKATFDRRWSEGAKWLGNKGYHLGGFHGVTSFWKYTAAGSFQAKLHRVGSRLADGGKPLSKSETKYFARMGMDEDTLIRISKMPMKDKDGNQNFNMSGWDEDLQELTFDSMNRATNESVLEPSGYDMPRITSGGDDIGAVSAIFMQYQRFPLAAYNMYIKNGMSDRDAKIMASLATTFVAGALVLYIKEESEVAMGLLKKNDRRYNIFSDNERVASEAKARLGVDVMNKAPAMTMVPKFLSMGQAFTRQEQLGPDDYLLKPGQTAEPVSLGVASKIWGYSADAIEDGEYPTKLLKLTPVGRHPLTQGFIDYTVEKYD